MNDFEESESFGVESFGVESFGVESFGEAFFGSVLQMFIALSGPIKVKSLTPWAARLRIGGS